MRIVALRILRMYKLVLSPYVPSACRYTPTCSVYAHEAIDRHGGMRGTWLAMKRLGRCHPLSRSGGYDPVP